MEWQQWKTFQCSASVAKWTNRTIYEFTDSHLCLAGRCQEYHSSVKIWKNTHRIFWAKQRTWRTSWSYRTSDTDRLTNISGTYHDEDSPRDQEKDAQVKMSLHRILEGSSFSSMFNEIEWLTSQTQQCSLWVQASLSSHPTCEFSRSQKVVFSFPHYMSPVPWAALAAHCGPHPNVYFPITDWLRWPCEFHITIHSKKHWFERTSIRTGNQLRDFVTDRYIFCIGPSRCKLIFTYRCSSNTTAYLQKHLQHLTPTKLWPRPHAEWPPVHVCLQQKVDISVLLPHPPALLRLVASCHTPESPRKTNLIPVTSSPTWELCQCLPNPQVLQVTKAIPGWLKTQLSRGPVHNIKFLDGLADVLLTEVHTQRCPETVLTSHTLLVVMCDRGHQDLLPRSHLTAHLTTFEVDLRASPWKQRLRHLERARAPLEKPSSFTLHSLHHEDDDNAPHDLEWSLSSP